MDGVLFSPMCKHLRIAFVSSAECKPSLLTILAFPAIRRSKERFQVLRVREGVGDSEQELGGKQAGGVGIRNAIEYYSLLNTV